MSLIVVGSWGCVRCELGVGVQRSRLSGGGYGDGNRRCYNHRGNRHADPRKIPRSSSTSARRGTPSPSGNRYGYLPHRATFLESWHKVLWTAGETRHERDLWINEGDLWMKYIRKMCTPPPPLVESSSSFLAVNCLRDESSRLSWPTRRASTSWRNIHRR